MRGQRASGLGVFLLALLLSFPLALAAYSHARIVQLSFVQGSVYVLQPGRAEQTRGLAYLPLAHGATVETPDGVAELEFESEALARLAPGARLHLAELGLHDTGERVTHLSLEQGTGTFEAHLRGGDTFVVVTPSFQLSVPESAKFRVDVTPESGRVRVFKGRVIVDSHGSAVQVSKGQTFVWDAAQEEYELARRLERDAWDEWNDYRDSVIGTRTAYGSSIGRFGTSYWPYSWGYLANPYSYCGYYDPFASWWGWGTTAYYGWSLSYACGIGYPTFGPIGFRPRGGGPVIPGGSPPPPTDSDPESAPLTDDGLDAGEEPNFDDARDETLPFRRLPDRPKDFPRRVAPEQRQPSVRDANERSMNPPSAEPGITRERDSSDEARPASQRLRRIAPARPDARRREAARKDRVPRKSRRTVSSQSNRSQQRQATRQRAPRPSGKRPSARRPSVRGPSARPRRQVRPRSSRPPAPRVQSRTMQRAPRSRATRAAPPPKHN